MIKEDNNGFVSFPAHGPLFNVEDKKTLVYLVVFHPDDMYDGPYILSNTRIDNISEYLVGDDVLGYMNRKLDDRYFIGEKSITMSGAICVGWNNRSFLSVDNNTPWVANFRDLTHEGRKLYYSMKKLHNQKEVRILTFSSL